MHRGETLTENSMISISDIHRLMKLIFSLEVAFCLVQWYFYSIICFILFIGLFLAVEKDLCFLLEDNAKKYGSKTVNIVIESIKKRYGKPEKISKESIKSNENIEKNDILCKDDSGCSEISGISGDHKTGVDRSNSVIYKPDNNPAGNTSSNISVN